jgi:hypothetical protein
VHYLVAMRLTGPLWRVIGSVVSWALFAFCFTLLFLGATTVMGLGGYCASGGPYVIETECPAAVVATLPASIFGGIGAVAVGIFLARGFGTPLFSWAWPVLFIGLGIGFVLAAVTTGAWSFLLVGVLFVVMGAVPLVLELRLNPRELFLGATNALDEAFVKPENARRSIFSVGLARPGGEVVPTGLDWVTSLGIAAASIGAGIWLGQLLFTSF